MKHRWRVISIVSKAYFLGGSGKSMMGGQKLETDRQAMRLLRFERFHAGVSQLITLLFVMLLTAACSPVEMGLQSRPTDLESARNLAERIARNANCGSFEDLDFQPGRFAVFTCQTGINGERMFSIWTFFDGVAKEQASRELTARGESFVAGPFYQIVESGRPGREHETHDYSAFPGKPVTPELRK